MIIGRNEVFVGGMYVLAQFMCELSAQFGGARTWVDGSASAVIRVGLFVCGMRTCTTNK